SRPLRRSEIGQRDIVAVHEREAEIVVHEVERFSHLLRLLVNEAEDALVFAGMDLVAEIELEGEAGVLSPVFPNQRRDKLTVALDSKTKPRLGGVKPVVQDIQD